MADFTSVLDRPLEEIEKPKPVPTGVYYGQIVGVPKMRELKGKDGSMSNVLDFNIKLTSNKQVDRPDDLAEFDLGGARPVQKTFFYDSDDGMWALKQFLENHVGLGTVPGRSVKQACAEAVGKQLLVTIGHQMGTDANGQPAIFTRVTTTAPV